jgi:intracellular septation protein
MSQKKPINAGLKMGLELGPVILFFILYTRIKDQSFTILDSTYQGFIVATALFIPVVVAATAYLWWRTGHLSRMQLMTAILVVVFGGLGIWFNDERFFKMKPTILYLMFGIFLGVGLLQGKSYVQYVMAEAMVMTDAGWMIFTKRITALFFALAIANEAIWRTMSTDAWVNFKTFGLPGILFLFIMAQMKLFTTYVPDETPPAKD